LLTRPRGPAGAAPPAKTAAHRPDPLQEQASRPDGPRFPQNGERPGYSPELTRVFDQTPTLIWACDEQLRVSKVIYSNIELEESRFIGRTDYDWLPAEQADALTLIKRRALEEHRPQRERVSCTWADQTHEIDLLVVPNMNDLGEPSGITCVSRDITDQMDWLSTHPAVGLEQVEAQQRSRRRLGWPLLRRSPKSQAPASEEACVGGAAAAAGTSVSPVTSGACCSTCWHAATR
jgi:hypothetical protein